MQMDEAINRLLSAYGTHELAACALGYSDRQYRNIRQKVARGDPLPPRIAALISLKLKQIQSDCRKTGISEVDHAGR